ncbi:probable adenylate kinase 7, mitochondrial isoform X2 [Malania oleifera]|uniref:probable adenylate kinase 7, mitochondrial isoform X2 n=1 Tax=Malania oleifera TaxID=397392 RepID=UPI0025ADCE02|nr:probable adenylate kinase 7, mitochondrial isoform X2 [Malania oleifera]
MAGFGRSMTSISAGAAGPPSLRLLHSVFRRFFGTAAAQPLRDHDHYCYRNEGEPRQYELVSPAMADPEGSVPLRGVQWVFIGAKKHVYAERLSKLLEVPHISMRSLVHQDLCPRSALYKQIANAVNQGKIVSEDIIFGLLSKRLEDGYYRGESGFILDGIPRTQVQAEILDQLAEIDLVVNFKCMEDCSAKHQGSSIFSHCRDSHGISNPASTSFDMLSQCTQLNCSVANTEISLKGKPQAYAKQRKPVEDYYRKQKKLLDFQVGSAPGETWEGLLAALHLQHISPPHSSKKLTTGSSWLSP